MVSVCARVLFQRQHQLLIEKFQFRNPRRGVSEVEEVVDATGCHAEEAPSSENENAKAQIYLNSIAKNIFSRAPSPIRYL